MSKPKIEGVPFSLICERCDAGMHITSEQQAWDEGWDEHIEFDPAGYSWNFIGTCPDCKDKT